MLLALKLFITPALIVGLTLIARRFGPGIAGWLGGLPISAGPIALFLAFEQGPAFTAQAAVTTIASLAGTAAYCLAYAHAARRGRWPFALGCTVLTWGLCVVALYWLAQFAWFGLMVAVVVAVTAIVLSLLCYPPFDNPTEGELPRGQWDLVLRVFATWSILFAVTLLATTLGPIWTGLFTTFPVVSTVLAIFAHRQVTANPHAPRAVAALLRGIVSGSGSTIAFFVVLGVLLPQGNLAVSFGCAVLAALAVQAVSYYWLKPGAARSA